MNILGIFGNIDTANASSIQINALLKHIKIKYYKISDKIKYIKSSNFYDKFLLKTKIYDMDKKVINTNEIKTIEQVDEQLKQKKFNVIFGWSNPYIAST